MFRAFAAVLLGLALVQGLSAQEASMRTGVKARVAMAADADPDFQVATVKPSDPAAAGGWAFPQEGNQIRCVNATLENILVMAYGIHPRQLIGGPVWLRRDAFDVTGTPDVPGVPNLQQVQGMYRKLLAERFQLQFHREFRTLPVYAIRVSKGGPKLKTSSPDESMNAGTSGNAAQRTMRFTSMSIPAFALNLNFLEDRPVVDQTSLPGKYDFSLKWSTQITTESDPDAPPSLSTAMRDQIGLRLDAVKAPVEVFVIDHLERPSPN